MKCTSCKNEISEGAKFCKFCGTPVSAASKDTVTTEKICSNCNQSVSATAKFCKFCGERIDADSSIDNNESNNSSTSEKSPSSKDMNVTVKENYVTWHVLPSQLAVKLDESDIAAYKTVKGVYITPGTKALFFANGRYVAELSSGTYPFKNIERADDAPPPSPTIKPTVWNFIKRIANHIANGASALLGGHRIQQRDAIGDRIFYTVVLVRGADFPLAFDFDNIMTKNIRSHVGLHMICRLTNLNEFFEAQLVDKKMVSLDQIANDEKFNLKYVVRNTVSKMLSKYVPYEVINNIELTSQLTEELNASLSAIFPYIKVSNVINLTADREELEKILRMQEELYIANLELEQLQLRNNYLNRLQSVEHEQELNMAREQVDFEGLMDKIDEDRLLNEDKKNAFVEMLMAQAELRSARTESETIVALNKLEGTNLLSAEEFEALKMDVMHRLEMKDVANEHAVAMATIHNTVLQEEEKLRWESKLFDTQLQRARMQSQFADERRDADFEFEKKKTANRMDLLRQAQEMREQREQAAHQREMELKKLESESELEHHKITATMSFEQIMASNPNISPDAAAALAKKFEAQAAMAQNDKTIELVKQHDEDLKNILSMQMQMTNNIIDSQNQMRDRELANKQAELDRVHTDSEKNQDRFLSGMQTATAAVSDAIKGTPVMAMGATTVAFCQNCGKKFASGTTVCDKCGATL